MRLAQSQASPFPDSQVKAWGGASAYCFGSAAADTRSPATEPAGIAGVTFRARPATWPKLPAGLTPFFGIALPTGQFAFGLQNTSNNELKYTAAATGIAIWSPSTESLEVLLIPTTTGVFDPPNVGTAVPWNAGTTFVVGNVVSYGGSDYQAIATSTDMPPPNAAYWSTPATGTPTDSLACVEIGGVPTIFAVLPTASYGGWDQTEFGKPYAIAAFQFVSGSWSFDPTHSWTADQLGASSTAGGLAFPQTTQNGQTYALSYGLNQIVAAPASGHLIATRYFHSGGTNSGALVAINPATGVVTAFYQLPSISASGSQYTSGLGTPSSQIAEGTSLSISPRNLVANPYSSAGDERVIVTTDSFVTSGNGNAGHQVIEFTYTGTAIEQLSPAIDPPATYTYYKTFNLAGFDPEGNLWIMTQGGAGLGVFTVRETHVFKCSAKGGNLPTLEGAGPTGPWPTPQAGDLLVGGQVISGLSGMAGGGSVNSDASRVILTDENGHLEAHTPQSPFNLGSNLIENPTFGGSAAPSSTDWSGFFSAVVSAEANAAFTGGACGVIYAPDAGNGFISQQLAGITPGLNYWGQCAFLAPVTPRQVKLILWWIDVDGNLLSAAASDTWEDSASGLTIVNAWGCPPATAVGVLFLAEVFNMAGGEQHYVGNPQLWSVPVESGQLISTNLARLKTGYSSCVAVKGDIAGSSLFVPVINPVGSQTFLEPPAWLLEVELGAL